MKDNIFFSKKIRFILSLTIIIVILFLVMFKMGIHRLFQKDDSSVGNIYGRGTMLENLDGQQHSSYLVSLIDNTFNYNIKFLNYTEVSGDFALLIFNDYKITHFEIEGHNHKNDIYFFKANPYEEISIPVRFDVEDNSSILLYTIINLDNYYSHRMLPFLSMRYNIEYDEEKYTSKNDNLLEVVEYSHIDHNKILDDQRQVISPTLNVNTGEKVQLYLPIKGEGVAEDFLVLMLLNFQQVKINDECYQTYHVSKGMNGLASITFDAPIKEGDYEVVFLRIPNPWIYMSGNDHNYLLLPDAFERFLLKVED